MLLNQCPHQLDLLQWLCGLPVRVHSFCHEGKWHDIEVEDDVTAYMEFANGATGVFITTTADAPGTNRFGNHRHERPPDLRRKRPDLRPPERGRAHLVRHLQGGL